MSSTYPVPSDEDLLEGRYNVDLGGILSDSFNLFMKHPGLYVVAGLIHVGIFMVSCGAALFVAGPLFAGFTIAGLKSMRGEPVEMGDFFAGFSKFGPLFLQSIVLGTLVLLGIAACILPGMYLAAVWMFAVPLVLDRDMNWWDAMEFSRKVAHKQFWMLLLLQLVVGAISGAMNSFVVLSFVAMPWMMLVYTAAYARIFGIQTRS